MQQIWFDVNLILFNISVFLFCSILKKTKTNINAKFKKQFHIDWPIDSYSIGFESNN